MALLDHMEAVEPTLLIVVGFVLFVFPEPATSALGVGLMLLGIAWWFQTWRSTPDVDRGDGMREVHPPRP